MSSIASNIRNTHKIIFLSLVLIVSFNLQAKEKGEWIKDLKTGCAVWNPSPKPNESISWTGDCISEKASGKGLLTIYIKEKLDTTYEGGMIEGLIHGQGVLTSAKGDRYKGQFKNGVPHGQGIMSFSEGGSYNGQLKEGVPHGQGVINFPDGSSYKGQFKEGKKYGQGVETTFESKVKNQLKPYIEKLLEVVSEKKEAENIHLFIQKSVIESPRFDKRLKNVLEGINEKREWFITILRYVKDKELGYFKYYPKYKEASASFELNEELHGRDVVKFKYENNKWYIR